MSAEKALHAAVTAIYFADSSDYLSALWTVVSELSPETVDLLREDKNAAYTKTKAAAFPGEPSSD